MFSLCEKTFISDGRHRPNVLVVLPPSPNTKVVSTAIRIRGDTDNSPVFDSIRMGIVTRIVVSLQSQHADTKEIFFTRSCARMVQKMAAGSDDTVGNRSTRWNPRRETEQNDGAEARCGLRCAFSFRSLISLISNLHS